MGTDGSGAEPEKDRELIITRSFEVPARILFQAYSRPEHVRQWFGPVGWPITLCEIDFRVGGRFRFAMTGPSGLQNTPFGGTYLEIVPDRRIVYDNGFEEPGAGTMIVTVTFDEHQERTTLTMRTVFETIAMKKAHVDHGFVQGVGSGYDQLTGLVTRLHTQVSR